MLKLPTGRLSRRVVLWVFASVIIIETIIFIPSANNRKKELLDQMRALSTAKINVVLQLSKDHQSKEDLFVYLKRLQTADSQIIGGAIYVDKNGPEFVFGEVPEITWDDAMGKNVFDRLYGNPLRYDAAWRPQRIENLDVLLVLRHDASPVMQALILFFLRIAGLVIIISLFVTTGAWIALEPTVITPILRLRSDLIKAGDAIRNDEPAPMFVTASMKRNDELGEVIAAFMQMYRKITETIAERKIAEDSLQKSYLQIKEYSRALNKEMEQGRSMQTNFLPAAMPSIPGWRFSAYFNPARQVSGDFYDAFDLPGGRIGVVIADVCDKGVGAALFMALFRSLIRIFSGQTTLAGLQLPPGPDEAPAHPHEILGDEFDRYHNNALAAVSMTNHYIAENHGDLGMFATLFFGVLCPTTGILSYINGGHEGPYIVNGVGIKTQLSPTGPAVGVLAEAEYKTGKVAMAPGDILIAYTDGVTEARSEDGALFSRQRLADLLDRPHTKAETLVEGIRKQLMEYIDKAPQEDDITLLAVQRA